MQYSDLAAVDIAPLKDELVDLVSVCLIKEPQYEHQATTTPAATTTTTTPSGFVAVARGSSDAVHRDPAETHSLSELAATVQFSSSTPEKLLELGGTPAAVQRRTDDTITRMRKLVHYVSKHDGEFVLKLALYVRLELYIRQTANFLTALCAREPNCVPYLACYMEKIVQLPSDWLSIANYAYFYDTDAAHCFHTPPLSNQAFYAADAKRKIPSGLRSALVHCFTKFTAFSLAKYDNERAEKKKRRTAQKGEASKSDSGDEHDGKTKRTICSFVWKTFTFKQLVRLLHITKPAYEVCCLLGRRYPSTAEEFARMGLDASHDGAAPVASSKTAKPAEGGSRQPQVFQPQLAGTRMRLPVPETWETQLAKEGNKGAVWDRLIAEGKVPFMALLRNLRNLITRSCDAATHDRVLQRLYSENEVANSKQFPFRFYSAFLAVADARERYGLARQLTATTLNRVTDKKVRQKALRTVKQLCEVCDYPYEKYDYDAALEAALLTSVKLNVVPIKGASIVIFCLSHALLSKVKAMGGGVSRPHVTSERTYLDLAALLILALERACEQCTVIICFADTYEVLPSSLQREEQDGKGGEKDDGGWSSAARTGLLARLLSFIDRCKLQLLDWQDRRGGARFSVVEAYYKKRTSAVFPYGVLDQLIENEVNISSVMVVDVGHHTYANMNKEAPSLGDLPIYLERMRRNGSEHLIFLALSVMEPKTAAPDAAEGLARMAQNPARDRYLHRNDVLLSGLSDSVLRLLAERAHGGPRALVERMDELYDVSRSAVRRDDYERERRRQALDGIQLTQKAQRRKSMAAVSATLGTLPGDKGKSVPHSNYYDGSGTGSGGGLTQSAAKSPAPSTSGPTANSMPVTIDWMKPHPTTLLHDSAMRLPLANLHGPLLSRSAEGETDNGVLASGLATVAASTAVEAEVHVEHPNSFITLTKVAPNRRLEDYGRSSGLRKKMMTRKAHETTIVPATTVATSRMNASGSVLDAGADTVASTHLTQTETAARSEVSLGTYPFVARGLLTQYRECRFFVSSTFLDMNNERNALTLDVFPHVRRWAAERGLKVSLLEVDLRWGITESATAENLSTSVCLNEVSRCAPFFIGMLGARYGSCPNPLHVVAADDVDLEDYGWLRDLPEEAAGQLSVTELEMRHGIYNVRRRLGAGQPHGAVFFAREQAPLKQSLPADDRGRVYDPDTPQTTERIAKLADFIASQQLPIISYHATYMERPATTERNAQAMETGDGGEEDAMEQAMLRKIRRGASEEESWGNAAAAAADASGAEGEKKGLRLEDVPLLRSYVTATAGSWDQKKVLTSQDVLLDMSDFAAKAFSAITSIVAQVCGVSAESLVSAKEREREKVVEMDAKAPSPFKASAPSATAPEKAKAQYYTSLFDDMHGFMDHLCKLYVPPDKVVEALATFALTGDVAASTSGGGSGGREEDEGGVASSLYAGGGRSEEMPSEVGAAAAAPPAQEWALTSEDKEGKMVTQLLGDDVAVASKHSHILLLYGEDGDGKSSAMAAVAQHLFGLNRMNICVIYYASQAGDGSLRSVVFFVALSLVWQVGLAEEFHIRESDSTESLLQVLPQIYIAAKRHQNRSIVVLLDGLDRSSEREQIVQHLGALVSPGVGPTVRYIVSTGPASLIASALHSRVPPVHEKTLPLLDYTERAQLVRLHLAHVGKRLQETMDLNELKDLLRKQDAGRPSYLTSALTYLRLFSSFDTLRDDVRYLPAMIGPLFQKMFKEIEKCFDRTTVCLVLTTLYLRQPVGGIMEYNLYRLVSNVAMATRLVDLLLGTCISSRHGCLMLCNSFFEASIGTTYLPYHSDRVRAWERMLAAELLYQPLASDTGRTSCQLRFVTESIQRNMKDPSIPCVFLPLRYAPHELLGVLQSVVQSNRLDLAVTLVCYLPFVETLLRDVSMLQPLIRYLSYLHIVAKNEMWRQKLEPVVLFLQNNYHILSRRPDLLTQCVLNSAGEETALSRYSMRYVNFLSHRRDAAHHHLHKEAAAVAGKERGVDGQVLPPALPATATASSTQSSTSGSISNSTKNNNSGEKSLAHTWTRWINATQQGGDTRLSLYHPAPREIRCMTINSSGKLVALGCEDAVVRVASTTTPELVCASLKHAAAVTALCFLSTRENVLISACEQGLLYVWSVEDGTLLQVGAGHLRQISSLVCHPVEPLVCTGGYDTYCLFWDVLGGTSSMHATLTALYEQRKKQKGGPLPPLRGGMLSSKASNKFSSLRVAGKQTTLKPFRAERHHEYPVSAVAFHRAGEVVATACWGGKVFLINTRDLNEEALFATPKVESGERHVLPYAFQCHNVQTAVRSLAFVPSLVVTCAIACDDGRVVLFDFASGVASRQLRGGCSAPFTNLAFSLDGKLMVVGDEQGSLRLSYAGIAGTELGFLNGHRRAITSVQFDPQHDDVLWSAGVDRSLQVWRIAAKEARTTPTSHSSSVTVIAVASDSSFFVTGGVDGLALVFTPNAELEQAHARRRLRQRCGNDGATTAVSDIFTPESYVPFFTLSHNGVRLTALAIGLQNTRIVVGTVTGEIYVWASQPGLDQQKGKLIAHLEASLTSLYPIVSLLCHDLYEAQERVERRTRATKTILRGKRGNDRDGNISSGRSSSDSSDDDYDDGSGTGAATQPSAFSSLLGGAAFPAAKIESLLVTGITLNGEAVKFRMYTDDAYLTLRKRRSVVPPKSAAGGQTAEEEIDGDDEEDEENEKHNKQAEGEDAHGNKVPTLISNEFLNIYRHKIAWLKPSARANELAHLVFPLASSSVADSLSAASKKKRSEEETSSRSGAASTSFSSPAATPTTFSALEERRGSGNVGVAGVGGRVVTFGEEVLKVLPLHVQLRTSSPSSQAKQKQKGSCLAPAAATIKGAAGAGKSEPGQLDDVTADEEGEDDTNYVPRFGGHHKHFAAPLRVTEHYSLLIGRTQFFLVSHHDGCARALPVYKTPLKLFHDDVFTTTLALEEDEYFQCASRLVPTRRKKRCGKRTKTSTQIAPSSGGTDTGGKREAEGQPTESFLLVVATNKGNIMFVEVKHLLADMQNSSTGSGSGEGGHTNVKRNDSQAQMEAMERLQSRIVLYHSHQMFIPRHGNKHTKSDSATEENKKFLIDSIDVLLYPASATATATATGEEDGMFLFAGCKDGTTHVLMSHAGSLDCKSAPQADAPERREHTSAFESVLLQHHYFTEVAIFFASSALTAQAVFPLASFAAADAAKLKPSSPAARTFGAKGEAQEARHAAAAAAAGKAMSTASLLSRVRWVVGDRLGSIYQLALADEIEHMQSECNNEEQRTQRHHLSTLYQQTPAQYNEAQLLGSLGACGRDHSSALGRALVEQTRGEVQAERLCGYADELLQGWAWNSRATMDWLKRVQLDALLPQKKVAASATDTISPSGAAHALVNATTASSPRKEPGVAPIMANRGKHSNTTPTTARDEWQRMLCEVAPQSSLLYTDTQADTDSMSALLSHLSFLPKTKDADSTQQQQQQQQPSACVQEAKSTEKKSPAMNMDFTPSATSDWDLWSDREMAKWMAKDSRADDGGEAPSHTPQTKKEAHTSFDSILPPLLFDAPVAPLPSLAKGGDADRAAAAANPRTVPQKPSTPTPDGLSKASAPAKEPIVKVLAPANCTDSSARPQEKNSTDQPTTTASAAAGSSRSYFSIITLAQPPAGLGVPQRKAWLQEKQRVLKEALRVRGYNEEARAALEVFRNQTMQSLQNINL